MMMIMSLIMMMMIMLWQQELVHERRQAAGNAAPHTPSSRDALMRQRQQQAEGPSHATDINARDDELEGDEDGDGATLDFEDFMAHKGGGPEGGGSPLDTLQVNILGTL
jgi:hypothetical protein